MLVVSMCFGQSSNASITISNNSHTGIFSLYTYVLLFIYLFSVMKLKKKQHFNIQYSLDSCELYHEDVILLHRVKSIKEYFCCWLWKWIVGDWT